MVVGYVQNGNQTFRRSPSSLSKPVRMRRRIKEECSTPKVHGVARILSRAKTKLYILFIETVDEFLLGQDRSSALALNPRLKKSQPSHLQRPQKDIHSTLLAVWSQKRRGGGGGGSINRYTIFQQKQSFSQKEYLGKEGRIISDAQFISLKTRRSKCVSTNGVWSVHHQVRKGERMNEKDTINRGTPARDGGNQLYKIVHVGSAQKKETEKNTRKKWQGVQYRLDQSPKTNIQKMKPKGKRIDYKTVVKIENWIEILEC